MKKGANTLIKIIAAGLALFGTYKIYKYLDTLEKEKQEKIEEHREEAINRVEGLLVRMDEWHTCINDVTLNNEKLKPADRAYAYTLYKEKYAAIKKAKTINAIDAALNDFEEFAKILTDTKDPETVETYLKILRDRQLHEEEVKEKKAFLDMELEKNRALVDMIEKVGTKAICNLVQ